MKKPHFFLFLAALCCAATQAQTRMVPHVTPVDGAFKTNFIFTNTVALAQDVQIMPFSIDGTALDVFTLTLDPNETRFMSTPELFPQGSVSHFMVGNENEVAITVVYQDSAGANSAAHVADSETQAVRWRIYPGTLDDVLDGLAVVNLDDQNRDIMVRQVSPDQGEIKRVTIFNLARKSKGLYLFGDFDKRDDAWFEVFSEGPLALTALRFSQVEGAGFFWETAAVPLPALVETGNEPPIITGQSALSVPSGRDITVTLDDLMVTDPDNNYPDDFTLTVLDGVSYNHDGNAVKPFFDFLGLLTVPVTVNDGTNDSAVYNLEITVTSPIDPRIGKVATLSSNATYGISGHATILDEHTIRLEDFSYNGGGPDVRVYLGMENDFVHGAAISATLSGTVFQDATMDLTIPDGYPLSEFNAISIWCTVFSVSFSDGVFE